MRFISALNSASFARRRLISVQLVFFMSFICCYPLKKNGPCKAFFTSKFHQDKGIPRANSRRHHKRIRS